MNPTRRDLWAGCLSAFGCETIFGLSYVFTKTATERASALALLGWRFAVAAAAMGALVAAGAVRVRWKGKRVWPLWRVAALSPVMYFLFETFGIVRTTASESGAIIACIPVATLGVSALLLRERPTGRQVAGILVSLAGVLAATFAAGASARFSGLGYGLLGGAVLSFALYCAAANRASREWSGAEMTLAMLVAGAGVFAPMAVAEAAWRGGMAGVGELLRLPARDGSFLGSVLFLALGSSVLAFFLSNVSLAKIGVNRAATFIGVATVVAIATGTAVLGEAFSGVQWAAAATIVLGVWIANTGGGGHGAPGTGRRDGGRSGEPAVPGSGGAEGKTG